MIGADDLVLARVSIDSSGVVRGMEQSNRAIAGGEAQIESLGATSAAAAGVSVAAFALIGTAVATVANQVIRTQENFGKFDKAVGSLGTTISRAIGNVTGLNQSLDDTATILNSINSSLSGMRNQPEGGLLRALWGNTDIGQVETLLRLWAEVVKSQDAKYGTGGTLASAPPWASLGSLNVPARPGAKGYQPLPPPAFPYGAYGTSGPPPYAPMATRVPETGGDSAGLAWLDDLQAKIEKQTKGVTDLAAAYAAMPDALRTFQQGTSDVNIELLQANENLDEQEERYNNLANTAVAANEFIGAAVAAGLVSQGAAARAAEAIQSALAIQKGAIEMAAAAASTAAYDYHGAFWHHVAAGLYFGAAAMHGVAAIAPSSGGGGGGGAPYGGPGSSQASLAQQSSRPAPVINVYVQGSLLGTSKEQLARDLAMLVRQGQRDGA